MKLVATHLDLSAGDLTNHMACRHLTTLNLAAAHGLLEQPPFRDPSLAALQARGLELEREYLETLRVQGLSISLPDEDDKITGQERVLAAMQEGVDIIYQAFLTEGQWKGRADFLRKVSTPSQLGAWSYEIIDTKLARETRGSTILQLCLYSEMLSPLQGLLPEYMHVVTPGSEDNEHSYRLADFLAYYRHMKQQLLAAIAAYHGPKDSYPVPCSFCHICNWWEHCHAQLRDDDHLTFVAGLGSGHIAELGRQALHTLQSFAETPLPLIFRPQRGAVETFARLREQARVQAETRASGQLIYELLPLEAERGVYRLPVPSPGDIFFDIEGDPYVSNTGLEFLFGWVEADGYRRVWALDGLQEKHAFEQFIDRVMELWIVNPDMHIYHFTAYEPSALKRLMGRFATKEQEVDQLLRAGKFIDVHSLARQTIRAGIESYSLKEMERLYGFERRFDLLEARQSLRLVQRELERQQGEPLDLESVQGIEAYNQDDCLSTLALRNWLEELRASLIADGDEIPRPPAKIAEPSETFNARQERIQNMIQMLLADVPELLHDRSPGQQAQWLLANMLDWYRREDKALWWEFFRLIDLSPVEMMEEKSGIGQLQFTGNRETAKSLVIDTYTYPSQDVEMRMDDELRCGGTGGQLGKVVLLDTNTQTIRIKKRLDTRDLHPDTIFSFTNVPNQVKEQSIERVAGWVMAAGVDAEGPYRAGLDLLMNITMRPDNGVLPIQGPPGAGKSHRAAEMILELVQAGKKVGITALSHKVITSLMHKVIELGKARGMNVTCLRKVSVVSEHPDPDIAEETNNSVIASFIRSGKANVIGGTAWLWSREDMEDIIDVLFVDEAGQLSLIDTVAVSPAAKRLVLLGDPQQLQQPQKGSHPEGTEVSALHHILGEHATIPEGKGEFLDTSWRMHPTICAFVSELFYEGRLTAKENLAHQRLSGETPFAGSGLFFCPVPHEGNQGSSIQEAEYVLALITALTNGQVYYHDQHQAQKVVSVQDIKVITPYNAQVNLLSSMLPAGIQVGTVDKFQGQEAPVIIFSMATSSPEDAPRGMEFLYSGNRFNVAVSRARSTFILVANEQLLEPDCRTVDQMRLANAFSRFLELARRID